MSQAHPGQIPQAQFTLPDVKHLVAVGAGKGGVGKSTVSALLAVGLQRRNRRVGILDADVYGPSIPTLMGVGDVRPEVDAERQRISPVSAAGVKVMSIGFMVQPDQAAVMRGPMVHGVLKQFLEQVDWGPLDYLIVDLPPGTGDAPLSLAQSIPVSGAVVVCTPQDLALSDARRAVTMYRKLNVPVLGIIENMSYYLCPQCGARDEIFDCGGAEQAAGALDIAFLGALPLNADIRRFSDAGTPDKNFTSAADSVRRALDDVVAAFEARISAHVADAPPAPSITFE